jgi:hypothetical protein
MIKTLFFLEIAQKQNKSQTILLQLFNIFFTFQVIQTQERMLMEQQRVIQHLRGRIQRGDINTSRGVVRYNPSRI